MVFSTLVVLSLYLPIVLLLYYLLPFRYRNLFLFLASLFFYGWGEPVYILLMLLTITVNYASGLLVDKYRDNDRLARHIVAASTVVSLGFLLYFKYADLLIGSCNSILGTSFPLLRLALPVGISFYTFQTMTYPIDIYRGDATVQRSYVSFGAYVALFPQLIAGPIVCYKDIDAQLNVREHSVGKFSAGAERFVTGLAKKVLLANGIGSLWDSYAAMSPSSLSAGGAWLGAVAFSLQIYFDFSGYSDMAIGMGKMLGFEFLENFNYPYISASVTEFWRRWHISLGSWFRDYVYIPLGGNRRGLPRQLLNLLIVWSLTGLWHGANWTFLLWGLYFAAFLVMEKIFLLRWIEKHRGIGHIYALLVAVCGWVIFQLDSVGEAVGYYRAMFGLGSARWGAGDLFLLRSYLPILLVALLGATPLPKKLWQRLPERLRGVLTPLLILLGLTVCTAKLTNDTYNPFLYFRF